ncbi:MAG: hypothetical protein K2X87_05475 [Gemmataceae bacterium]|nr:hypothetical protein [Gemmataceae bacterium]
MSDAPAATPEAPADEPKGLLDKLGAALPVGLTAIATAFAGMSTTELSRAMYWKSQAAQDQAKAADQWSLAGFKRDRSLICQAAADQLRALAAPNAGDNNSTAGQAEMPALGRLDELARTLPEARPAAVDDPAVRAALDAVRGRQPESETVPLARKADREAINGAIADAEAAAAAYDRETDQFLRTADEAAAAARKGLPAVGPKFAGGIQAWRYDLDRKRYRAEASLNQAVGFLYEVRVRWSGAESDRHRHKSETFFYAMLAAQVGATVSALGLARKHKSLLWTVAGLAGVVSVAIGAYVYLT